MNMEIDTLSERSEEEGEREDAARPKVGADTWHSGAVLNVYNYTGEEQAG